MDMKTAFHSYLVNPLQNFSVKHSTISTLVGAAAIGFFAGKHRIFSSAFQACGCALIGSAAVSLLLASVSKKSERHHRWVTGTNSSTLGLMLAAHRINKLADLKLAGPALVPPNQLIKRGIAPLAGESGAHSCLYGCDGSQFLLALSYAQSFLTPFDLNQAWGKALSKPDSLSVESYLTHLSLYITRILQMGATSQERQKLRDHLEQTVFPIFSSVESFQKYFKPYAVEYWISEAGFNADYNQEFLNKLQPLIQSVHAALNTQSLELNQNELELIRNPCPLVFASDSLGATAPQLGILGVLGERTIDSPVVLGKDIRYVYTTLENLKRIAQAVAPFGVQARVISLISIRSSS